MDFIGLCEKWRLKLGKTQREIVRGVIDPGRYSNLKSDPRRQTGDDIGLSLYQAAQIARNLGVPLDYLVDERAGEDGALVTDDEMTIIKYVRHKNISMPEALDRLSRDGTIVAVPSPSPRRDYVTDPQGSAQAEQQPPRRSGGMR